MKTIIILFAFALTSLFASSIQIENSYVRATPPSLPTSAAFMNIKNNSDKKISIISASSNISKVVELHTHDVKDGVMKMYQIPKIDIKAKGSTKLQPGGLHIMFIGLQKPLKEGQKVSLTLNFSNNETKTILLPVKKVMAGMKHHAMHMKDK